MSVASNQLGEIHQQLTDLFNAHPTITVAPIAGDPPNQYQITYNIKGLSRTEDGEIAFSTNHIIELTIPFGFPHFPPSCKPKSNIFHPDFDPAAICLGDVWEQDRSIVNLIIHIGKLINGDLYSTSNAFNEEAAQWYEEHADQFPLDDEPIINPGQSVNTTSRQPSGDIDMLDDTDLSSDFDFLSLDHSDLEEQETTQFTEEEVDLSHLQLLERQGKYFELRGLISEISMPSEEISDLLTEAEQKIAAAKELQRQAKEAERDKGASNAQELYEQLLAMVSDYPGAATSLQNLRSKSKPVAKATQKSLEDELLAELNLGQEPPEQPKPPKKEKKKHQAKAKKSQVSKKSDPFADERRQSSKIPLFLACGVLFILLTGGGYYYFTEKSYLSTAQENYAKCQKQIDSYLFEEANESCSAGQAALKHVRFLNRDSNKELSQKIGEILDSETLRQGLAGNVLMDGQYLPKKDATIIRQFRKIQTEAEALFHQQEWNKAEELLKEANKLAEQTHYIPAPEKEAASVRLAVIHFRQPFDIGRRLLKDEKYKEAMVELEKAKLNLAKIPAASRETFDKDLRSSMSQAQIEQLQLEAKHLFSSSNWQEAYRAYDKTLSIAQDTPQMSHRTMLELQTNMARAELYQTIEDGNGFFSTGEWDKAIEKYTKAGKYLEKNLVILNLPEANTSRSKLEHVTLQAVIIRDKQIADRKIQDSKLEEARKLYQDLLNRITNSTFAAEPDFATQMAELKSSISDLDQRIYLLKKEEYLRTNFQKLFTTMYSTVSAENLSNPVINYVREEGEKLIFRMQCTEVGRGRPLTLVMFYAYNKKADSWALHIEQ